MSKNKIRVAISHGDINGISYEVLLKVFKDDSILDLFTPVVYGSIRIANYWKQKLGIESLGWYQIKSANELKEGRVNVINCVNDDCMVTSGVPNDISGLMAYSSLISASNDVARGLCDVLVTAPICKNVMPKDVFPYNGHTDFFEANHSGSKRTMMILVCDNVRVALVTTHIPVKDIASYITKDFIIQKLVDFEHALKRDFNIIKPRIAVLGLNPHCGDNGLIGLEEEKIIIPAIDEAYESGILAFGPYAADGFFGSDMMNKFDGVLSMYHDQGLAPFKALFMNRGVNFTSGIDFIRTSPDHGTGFDIVGKGVATAESFKEAIYLAIDTYKMRKLFDEATKNPLLYTYVAGHRDENIDMSKFEE